MKRQNGSILYTITGIYNSLTTIEKIIADYFLSAPDPRNLSAKSVSAKLFVSTASLTRFSQKCGFVGYRQFIFAYQQEQVRGCERPQSEGFLSSLFNVYESLMNETWNLYEEEQIKRICTLFATKNRIYIYGIGSSGLVATEMQMRLVRLGLNIYSITDSHLMEINSVILNENCMVVGLSISGKTKELLKALKAAKSAGASTALITSLKSTKYDSFCDEVIHIGYQEKLATGKIISPQFPLLLMSDIIYACYLSTDTGHKELLHQYTLDILDQS